MELDLNRFRTLVPIDTLEESKIRFLSKQVRVERFGRGAIIFEQGNNDPDSLFLMLGRVELISSDGQISVVVAGSDQGLHALANLKPRRFSGKAVSHGVIIARLDTATLDRALTLDQLGGADSGCGMEVAELGGPDAFDSEWMMTLLQAPSFQKLPAANLQTLFTRLQEVEFGSGETVIEQGGEGDYFYLIKRGTALISRKIGHADKVFAELNAPHGFGEEALLTDSPRNATVRMKTDGVLMRLSKEDFRFLMQAPLINEVTVKEAGKLVRAGAQRIDVRSEKEFAQGSLRGSKNLPLYLLRLKMARLDKKQAYVLFCDTGSRSSAAAFLMSEKGFSDVHILKGGLAVALKERRDRVK